LRYGHSGRGGFITMIFIAMGVRNLPWKNHQTREK
jgi:hypothetical protein